MPLIRYALLLTLCCLLAAADTVTNLEVKLNADPNNIQLRADLMDAYAEAGNAPGYVQQVFWFVENHPESKLLIARGNMAAKGGRFNTAADFEQVRAAWEVQLNLHSDSGPVLLNAALFLRASDPLRAVDLLEQARKTTPASSVYAESEARVFTDAFMGAFPKDTDDLLKARLLASSDAELLCDTGSKLKNAAGVDLMRKAVSLDPSNAKWRNALQQAIASPAQ